jgi:hypothetical protein
MTNENRLAGMRCPACGSDGPFYIECLAVFLVSDSGTDDCSGVDWSEDSHCDCHACCHHATVTGFTLTAPAKGGAQ